MLQAGVCMCVCERDTTTSIYNHQIKAVMRLLNVRLLIQLKRGQRVYSRASAPKVAVKQVEYVFVFYFVWVNTELLYIYIFPQSFRELSIQNRIK